MSLTIKAFLYEQSWHGEPKEIRRFSVDQDVSTSYTYLLEKLAQVFPSVQAGSVVVAWMDSDSDLVVISSDAELVEALDQFDGTIFRLYLKRRSSGEFQRDSFSVPAPPAQPREQEPTTVEGGEGGGQQPATGGVDSSTQQQSQQPQPGQSKQQEDVVHPGVVCDGCNGPIQGTRFKCLVCNDYDLCSGCEAQGKHVDHNMVTITDPFYSPWGFKHPWARGFGGGHPCHGWWGQRGHHPFGHHGGHHGGHHHGFGHHGYGGYGPTGSGCPVGGPWGGFGRGGGSCPRGAFRGRRCGGGAPWWGWRSAVEQEAGQRQQQTSGAGGEPMETGADTQQQQQPPQPPSEEERKSFLQGVGQAVSSFLEPFGVKVDVNVVGDGDKTPTAPPPSGQEAGSTAAEPTEEVPSEFIEQALTQLRSMGYEDEGGWLTELVKAKGGDISKVLDALHPTVTETD